METVRLPSRFLALDAADDGDEAIGGLVGRSRRAWLAAGRRLAAVDARTGANVGAWTFERDARVACACACAAQDTDDERAQRMIVGLECDPIGGCVALLHCNGSRLVRCVQIDCRIVSIDFVPKINDGLLECFDGIVIVGCHGGGVIAFELDAQRCEREDSTGDAQLVVLSLDDVRALPQQRAIARKKGHHIGVQINERCFFGRELVLDCNTRVPTDVAFVSCVRYIPQLESVVIGYGVGVFQLWNLRTLKPQYTSRAPQHLDGVPVSHVGFVEPCDDPRAFCYLWIVYSSPNRFERGFPSAVMYSLTYREKKLTADRKIVYQNFLSCDLRFNIDMKVIDATNGAGKYIGGRSLGCHTLTKVVDKQDSDEYSLRICQLVWECWTVSTIAPVQSIMVLFDIDQWYKEQMPESCELKTNNYMSVVNLGDIVSNSGNSYLCDVKIDPDTLSSYISVQRLEEHFFPNAIGYECYCLSNTSITKFVTMGIQRQIIASINQIGPPILLNPAKLFHQCVCTGLIPLYIDDINLNSNLSESVQREILLSVALEARLVQFLGKCAIDWATGSHSSVGCTLQFLLNWAWQRTLTLKENGDRLAVSFFNHSDDLPDRYTIQCLDNCVRQLGHITSLYSLVIEKCSSNILPERLTELKECQKGIKMVAQYFHVIQWFVTVGLLPEFYDRQLEHDDRLPYPLQSLIKFYENRRHKLHCLNGGNPNNEDLKNKFCDLLFIDQFIEIECAGKKLKELWMLDESTVNGLYPPPSLHSLLKVYLIPEVTEEHKHSLVLYMLVDYAMLFDNERYERVIRHLMQFPTMFGLSTMAIKTTQAFWHLDHRDFQLALNQLQFVLAGNCLSQWQHNVVLSSLLVQKKTQSALQYLHVRKPHMSLHSGDKCDILYDDWDACSNLYLSRGLVYEAYEINKESVKTLPSSAHEQRLKIFFEGCRKFGLLAKVISLPLTHYEENVFIDFLKCLNEAQSNDIMVLYYLKRSRYIEAKRANETLKRFSCKEQLPYDIANNFSMKKEYVLKSEARDQLVELYYKSLPPITRQLAQYARTDSLNVKGHVPVPMTVNVQNVAHKAASYKSSFIQETIDKANETWLNNPLVMRNLKRPLDIDQVPFLCSPKLTNRSLRYTEKMSTTPDGSTPCKRAKLNDTADVTIQSETVGVNSSLQQEIDRLLHTPIVERVNSRNIASSRGKFARRIIKDVTPHSILKVKKMYSNAEINESNRDDELSVHSQFSHSSSRSIRFNIPHRNSSPQLEMNESYMDLCGFDNKNNFVAEDTSDNVDVEVEACPSLTCETPPLEELDSTLHTEEIYNSEKNESPNSKNTSSKIIRFPTPRRSIRISNLNKTPQKVEEKETTIIKSLSSALEELEKEKYNNSISQSSIMNNPAKTINLNNTTVEEIILEENLTLQEDCSEKIIEKDVTEFDDDEYSLEVDASSHQSICGDSSPQISDESILSSEDESTLHLSVESPDSALQEQNENEEMSSTDQKEQMLMKDASTPAEETLSNNTLMETCHGDNSEINNDNLELPVLEEDNEIDDDVPSIQIENNVDLTLSIVGNNKSEIDVKEDIRTADENDLNKISRIETCIETNSECENVETNIDKTVLGEEEELGTENVYGVNISLAIAEQVDEPQSYSNLKVSTEDNTKNIVDAEANLIYSESSIEELENIDASVEEQSSNNPTTDLKILSHNFNVPLEEKSNDDSLTDLKISSRNIDVPIKKQLSDEPPTDLEISSHNIAVPLEGQSSDDPLTDLKISSQNIDVPMKEQLSDEPPTELKILSSNVHKNIVIETMERLQDQSTVSTESSVVKTEQKSPDFKTSPLDISENIIILKTEQKNSHIDTSENISSVKAESPLDISENIDIINTEQRTLLVDTSENISSVKAESPLNISEDVGTINTEQKTLLIDTSENISVVTAEQIDLSKTSSEGTDVTKKEQSDDQLLENVDSSSSVGIPEGTISPIEKVKTNRFRRRKSSCSSSASLVIIDEEVASDKEDTSIDISPVSSSKKYTRNSDNILFKRKHDTSVSSCEESRMSSSRRSTRNSSKMDTSFLSQSSIDSDQESTSSSLRKSRRSIMPSVKPNLSVIPEVSQIEDERRQSRSSLKDSKIIETYSTNRRLTRHQRSLLEKSIESSSSLVVEKMSNTDTQHKDSMTDESIEDNVSHCSSFTENTLDPIMLLDKGDFDGQPDLDECGVCDSAINSSRASSVISDLDIDAGGYNVRKMDCVYDLKKLPSTSDGQRARTTPLKIIDKVIDSNVSTPGSPSSRPRRESFNKAIEALSTPRRKRRASTDSRKSSTAEAGEVSLNSTKVAEESNAPTAALETTILETVKEEQSEKFEIRSESLDLVPELKTVKTATKTKKFRKAASVHGADELLEASERKPTVRKSRKALSLHCGEHGDGVSTPETTSRYSRSTRLSLLSTPLSKEDISAIDLDRGPYQTRTKVRRAIRPLEIVLRKK